MCLFNANIINLEEDLTVYKILIKNRTVTYGDKKYTFELCSPYYPYNWKLNTEYNTNCQPYSFWQYMGHKNVLNVYGNAFHSFENFNDAIDGLMEITSHNINTEYGKNTFVIAECVIPKSSEFVYCGYFDKAPCYASTSLIVKEIVYEHKN